MKSPSFSRIQTQLAKNDVVPTSSQDEALARYSVSREVPCSVLKCETVLCTLDATPNVPGHAGLTRKIDKPLERYTAVKLFNAVILKS